MPRRWVKQARPPEIIVAKDPEWTALLAKYKVPLDIEAFMMSASDYSSLK